MSELSEIFSRDPRKYTKEGGELDKIIAHYRAARHAFNAGNKKAGASKPKPKDKEVHSLLSKLELDL